MNKAKNKLIRYAVIVVFILLTVLIGVINIINFTMAANDADTITLALANQNGSFEGNMQGGFGNMPQDMQDPFSNMPGDMQSPENMQGPGQMGPGSMNPDAMNQSFITSAQGNDQRPQDGNYYFDGQQGRRGQMGPMGPSSPEMTESIRYFTYAFDKSGNAFKVAYQISAVSENDAAEWAKSLLSGSTGWTRGTYRYRVYTKDNLTFVTVIDQGRELLPSYRILIISVVGEIVSIAILYLFLLRAGKKLFEPLEAADRKQKQFIEGMEQEFQVPMTVINADVELLERKGGVSDQTSSIRRQVKTMSGLLAHLSGFALFESEETKVKADLSKIVTEAVENKPAAYKEKNIEVDVQIASGIEMEANAEDLKAMTEELLLNGSKYAKSFLKLSLSKTGERIKLQFENDTDLEDGEYDQVFDRFTRLSNAEEGSLGLGLSNVKEIVQKYSGRAKAFVKDSVFTVQIDL